MSEVPEEQLAAKVEYTADPNLRADAIKNAVTFARNTLGARLADLMIHGGKYEVDFQLTDRPPGRSSLYDHGEIVASARVRALRTRNKHRSRDPRDPEEERND